MKSAEPQMQIDIWSDSLDVRCFWVDWNKFPHHASVLSSGLKVTDLFVIL